MRRWLALVIIAVGILAWAYTFSILYLRIHSGGTTIFDFKLVS